MTNDSLKTAEKAFRLHVVDGIHPSKRSILKNYSMLYFENEPMYCNHKAYHDHMGLQCTLSHRAFL